MSNNTEDLRLILILAANFQGGNSAEGGKIAERLGIPFPLNMRNLGKAAIRLGFEPSELWPWSATWGDRSL